MLLGICSPRVQLFTSLKYCVNSCLYKPNSFVQRCKMISRGKYTQPHSSRNGYRPLWAGRIGEYRIFSIKRRAPNKRRVSKVEW